MYLAPSLRHRSLRSRRSPARYNALAGQPARLRDRADVEHFFDGLDLVEPGVVPLPQWRPGSELEARARGSMGRVARKAERPGRTL